MPDSLLESELFGHAKGSFTGASCDKPGLLQLAHRGTLFLDEVGETTSRMQTLLLRFLETGEIQRVGSTIREAKLDVRIIAATNRDLSASVSIGQFRQDFFYRLNVIRIHVPPLRSAWMIFRSFLSISHRACMHAPASLPFVCIRHRAGASNLSLARQCS